MRAASSTTLAATAALAGFGFVALAAAVKGRHLRAVDRSVRREVQAAQAPAGTKAAERVGPIGKESWHLPVALGLSAYLWHRDAGARAVLPFAASAASAIGSYAFEHSPPIQLPPPGHPTPDEPSFPSGHAFETSALGLTTAYVFAREGHVRFSQAVTLTTALSASTTAGRIYLDRHWLSDVLGGWLLGTATAAMFALAYESLRTDSRVPSDN